ncbi:MAG: membrane protein insertase YidC [Planctomycetota bacterium]
MENRITSLLIPVIVVILGFLLIQQLFAPKAPKGSKQDTVRVVPDTFDPQTAPRILSKTVPGQHTIVVGSEDPRETEGEEPGYRVVFDNLGGTIRTVDRLDFYERPGLSDEEKTRNQYRIIQDAEPGLYSFGMEDYFRRYLVHDPKYPDSKGIGQKYWERVEGFSASEGVRYRLALSNGLTFEKDFLFEKGANHFVLEIRIRNSDKTGQHRSSFSYHLRGATTLALATRGPSFSTPPICFGAAKLGKELRMETSGPKGKAHSTRDLPDVLNILSNETFAFAGSGNRFFACILAPMDEMSAAAVTQVESASLPSRQRRGGPAPYRNCTSVMTIRQEIKRVPKDEDFAESKLRFMVFLGPKNRDLFSTAEYEAFLPVSDLDLNRGCFCSFGAPTMAKGLLVVLKFFQSFLGNWGVAIILLTFVVRASMSPFMMKQAKTMRVYQEKMTRLKPEMDAIKEKYKNDKKQLNQAMMEFQKKNKLFPPLMGCLPMFLTMPIFFGLFTMLRASIALRHQPFVGWISDLSEPDRLFHIEHSLPVVPKDINLLPLLMMSLWIYNSFNTPLSQESQQRQQQQIMRFMPLIFGVMLYNYASGLSLYMTISALWSLVEQRIVKKKTGGNVPVPTTF